MNEPRIKESFNKNQKGCIRLLYPKYVKEYEHIQEACLSHAKDFKAKPETYRWYPTMNQSITWGVFINNLPPEKSKYDSYSGNPIQSEKTPDSGSEVPLAIPKSEVLISTMRLEFIGNFSQLMPRINQPSTEIRRYEKDIQFPIGYLSKGATLEEFEGYGFNALLRYYSIKVCLNNSLKTLVGTMIEGGQRTQSLAEMGYHFINTNSVWNGFYQSQKNALVASLDLASRGYSALEWIESRHISLISQFPLSTELHQSFFQLKPPVLV